MEQKLYLKFPTMQDKSEWIEYYTEFKASNPDTNPLNFGLDKDYEEWLIDRTNESKGLNLKDGRVPSTIYFFMLDDKIIGHVSIRHNLEHEMLRTMGGHVGDGIRPSYRNQGYGTKLLQMTLPKCKELGLNEIMITCKKENVASEKCIRKNGAQFQDEIVYEGTPFLRFKIYL